MTALQSPNGLKDFTVLSPTSAIFKILSSVPNQVMCRRLGLPFGWLLVLKTEVELAEEYASQRQVRLLELQSIPSTGAAARAQLLAKMNIKRDAQCGTEKF